MRYWEGTAKRDWPLATLRDRTKLWIGCISFLLFDLMVRYGAGCFNKGRRGGK
ncbi:MAG: hypothetical protein F6K56_26190 [Moorea sp. SIO3G5]|nr:hypothetical protein [Moorena sp. SIO3G5]